MSILVPQSPLNCSNGIGLNSFRSFFDISGWGMNESLSRLAITICATAEYTFAMKAQARAVQENLHALGRRFEEVILIIVTDKNKPKIIEDIAKLYSELIPEIKVFIVRKDFKPHSQKDYGKQNSLTIGQMRTAAFSKARALDVDFIWSLDSDVLPDTNNLRCMADMLSFDGGYYSVAFVPYVSAGGGGYMGGRGTHQNHILPTVYEDEREIPEELKAEIEEHQNQRKELNPGQEPSEDWKNKARELGKKIEQCQPKGNVFELNSKQWRKRGWLEWAAPGIGKGAVLESDWMPFGNNLFARRAIPFLTFAGYTGAGTEDLSCGWNHLKPNGLKFCVLPHCVSHHVRRKENGYLSVYFMYHEPSGEGEGHLRHREIPFYEFEPGEGEFRFDNSQDIQWTPSI